MSTLCARFGFEDKKIAQRLESLYLSKSDARLAQRLNKEVISPGVDAIVERFYETLLFQAESRKFLLTGDIIGGLKVTQRHYLLTLGKEFVTQDYFEGRLRIGVVHAHIGLPLSVYQCAYSNLLQYIIDAFPRSVVEEKQDYAALVKFLIKITNLDISLAIEAYHASRIFDFEELLEQSHSREGQLRSQAESDFLTGLLNRETVFREIAEAIDSAQTHKSSIHVLMVDLDHFKTINDTHGHPVGDEVLKHAADAISQATRANDTVGRYGGEEFIVCLKGVSAKTAKTVAERIRKRIADTAIQIDQETITLTASLGIAHFHDGDDLKSLIHQADLALYKAKNGGRNRIAS